MRRRQTQQPTRQYDDAMTMMMTATATTTTKRKRMKTRTRTRTTTMTMTMTMTMMRTRTWTCGGGEHNNQRYNEMKYTLFSTSQKTTFPTCRQYVGNVSATTSLADIIIDHVGDMLDDMSPTIGEMLACRRF